MSSCSYHCMRTLKELEWKLTDLAVELINRGWNARVLFDKTGIPYLIATANGMKLALKTPRKSGKKPIFSAIEEEKVDARNTFDSLLADPKIRVDPEKWANNEDSTGKGGDKS